MSSLSAAAKVPEARDVKREKQRSPEKPRRKIYKVESWGPRPRRARGKVGDWRPGLPVQRRKRSECGGGRETHCRSESSQVLQGVLKRKARTV